MVAALVLLSACSGGKAHNAAGNSPTAVHSSSAASTSAPAYVDGTPIAGTFSSLSPGPSVARTHDVLMAFVTAYNRHDADGVLATLDDTFQYGDCDYAHHQYGAFKKDKAALRAWLGARFAQGDHFDVFEEDIASPVAVPPYDPHVAGLGLLRTNAGLQAQGRAPLKIGVKVLLTGQAGDRITTVAISSYETCTAMATPTPIPAR